MIAEHFGLGNPLGPMTRVHGGLLNRMWRLDTDRGSFAVKELNLQRDWTYRGGDVLRFEQAAFADGIPMPEPVADPSGSAVAELDGATVLVHRWVDGEKVPEQPVSIAFAREVGAILAQIHALSVEWTHVSIAEPMPTQAEWRTLADRAIAAGQPWAAELEAQVPAFGEIGRFVDDVGRPEPVVLTHRDVGQRNMLMCSGRPVILDWETSGEMPLACELGSTALNLSKGDALDSVQPAVFQAVLDGYVGGGGVLPAPGAHWFADLLGGWTWFVRWNVERCLADTEPLSGPSLAVAQDTVRRGLRGLPETLARLDDLAPLTAR